MAARPVRRTADGPAGDADASTSHVAREAADEAGVGAGGYKRTCSWDAEAGVALTCARYAWDGSLIVAGGATERVGRRRGGGEVA
jgi:hypothetical protein